MNVCECVKTYQEVASNSLIQVCRCENGFIKDVNVLEDEA